MELQEEDKYSEGRGTVLQFYWRPMYPDKIRAAGNLLQTPGVWIMAVIFPEVFRAECGGSNRMQQE